MMTRPLPPKPANAGGAVIAAVTGNISSIVLEEDSIQLMRYDRL